MNVRLMDSVHLKGMRQSHGILTADSTKDIVAAIDAVRAADKRNLPAADLSAYVTAALGAIKAYKGKYRDKHPKFIAELEQNYEKPLLAAARDIEGLAKSWPALKDARLRAYEATAALLDAVRDVPRDKAKVDRILERATTAGSARGTLLGQAKDLKQAGDRNPLLDDIIAKCRRAHELWTKAEPAVVHVKEKQQYTLPLTPVEDAVKQIVGVLVELKKPIEDMVRPRQLH